MFKQNVGGVDKVIRIVLGIGMIGAGIYYGSWLGAIGAIPLLTGIFGTCGLYSLLGINTCSIKK
ncbi:MAG TPA: DUF2892 domain-containing protein [bacterium]|nr:DUF2892 domain-containing protein [bacterium]